MTACINEWATKFIGFINKVSFEAIQLVKYQETELHDSHFDWFEYPPKLENGLTCNRDASFFVYLGSDCKGGETYFESLEPVPKNGDGSRFTKVASENEKGLAVKPIKGNALFWMNLHANNTGDQRVRHAALPIRSGIKHGMNLLMKRCFIAGPELNTFQN